MKKYKLLAGGHSEGDVSYKAGDIVESEHNLVKLFINKFEVWDGTAPKKKKKKKKEKKEKKEKEVPDAAEPVDVTESFEGAADGGIKVTRVGRKHYIYETDDLENPIEGGNGVSKKKAGDLVAVNIE